MPRRRIAVLLSVGLVVLASVAVVSWLATRAVPGGLNIVVLMIDTLRADHVGCYGYARPTTPSIDRFAGSAVTFANAYSVSSWTLPAVASLFTGLLPSRHGTRAEADLLPDSIPTLARLLHQRGYSTAAMSANFFFARAPDNFPAPPLHLAQGFDIFESPRLLADANDGEAVVILNWRLRTVRADAVTNRLIELLHKQRHPFFLFGLYIDPHYGYEPPPAYASLFEPAPIASAYTGLLNDMPHLATLPAGTDLAHLINLYDGEVRYADEQVGRFLAALDAAGLADKTVVVILSDHGEEFADHGRMVHAQALYEESVRIPLLIRAPTLPRGVRIVERVSLLDLMPTLLHLAGLDAPAGIDGRSLETTWDTQGRDSPPAPRQLLFELDNELTLLNGPRPHARGLSDGAWKILTAPGGAAELYNLATDPGERHDLAAEQPAELARMQHLLTAALARAPAPAPTRELTDVEKERLRALGYGTQPQ